MSIATQANTTRPTGSLMTIPNWFIAHAQTAGSSFTKLFINPFSSILTICVIGVALTLPATFLMLMNNVRSVHHGLDKSTRISLYLHSEISPSETDVLLSELKNRPEVMDVHYISKEEGLEEFSKQSGFRDVLARLPDNPLPPVIEVFPKPLLQAAVIEKLQDDLQHLSQVEMAKLDLQWVKRLQAILELGQQLMVALMFLFFAAVVLVIGNTIRMNISQQSEEIQVLKIIGATNAFIRRPFLHNGVYYGVLGGLFAALAVQILVWNLQGPVANLAQQYDSHFILVGLHGGQIAGILLSSMLLGLCGAWIAVHRQMSRLEP